MLGLASTYRCLGRYEDSQKLFEKAIQQYPENGALKAFYALTLHNLGQHGKSLEVLLKELVRSSNDKNVQAYQRAILFYADKPDETFE
jgi:tetratricopeptide (TPR) repeat protein